MITINNVYIKKDSDLPAGTSASQAIKVAIMSPVNTFVIRKFRLKRSSKKTP
jgi:hypothetical protein